MVKIIRAIALVALAMPASLHADTIPGGDVSGTWYAANSPYYVDGQITVPYGDTLTIEPGVDVIFLGLYRLTVSGRLIATGTPADSIRFFPQDTITGWQGLYYYATGSGTHNLDYCVIEHARESGIYIQAVLILNIRDCAIGHCRSSLGGGIHVHGLASNLNIKRSSICCNTAEAATGGMGGGIYLHYGRLKMDSCLVRANRAVIPTYEEAYPVRGGGIYVSFNAFCDTISSSTFSDNFIGLSNGGQSGGYPPDSTDGGAAVYTDGQSNNIVILECVFSGNTGNARFGQGGAIQATGHTGMTLISHCLFCDNRITSGDGTGSSLYIYNGADIINCTFSRNGRYSVWLENGHVRPYTVCNSIFASDTHGITFWNGMNDSAVVAYNDFMDDCISMPPGFGVLDTVNFNGDSCDCFFNIFMDPMFADTANGDFHLTAGSPCIDAGDPLFAFDPDGTISDMGAYWFDQELPVAALSDTALDFGSVYVGEQASLGLTIYNQGTADLMISGLANSLTVFTTDFDPADSLILPGDSLALTVTFTPADSTSYCDTLNIANNDQGRMVILNGLGQPTGVAGPSTPLGIPATFRLSASKPNPVRSAATIAYQLPKASRVILEIYDIAGRMVKRFDQGVKQPGHHSIKWNARGHGAGVYFCRLRAGSFIATRKLVVVK